MSTRNDYIKCKAFELYSLSTSTGTPDPFLLASLLGIHTKMAPLGHLKGFYVILEHMPFIVLNNTLPRDLAKVVCAHELGHHILHRSFEENCLFTDRQLIQNDSRLELEANLFACHFLLPDVLLEQVLQELVTGFGTVDVTCIAQRVSLPPELVQLKLKESGYPLAAPDSCFLK